MSVVQKTMDVLTDEYVLRLNTLMSDLLDNPLTIQQYNQAYMNILKEYLIESWNTVEFPKNNQGV